MSKENITPEAPESFQMTQEIFQALAGAMGAIVRRNNLFMDATIAMETRLKALEEKIEKIEKLLDT